MKEYESLSNPTNENENRSLEYIIMPNLFDMVRNYDK
jgi:hypothetical protein